MKYKDKEDRADRKRENDVSSPEITPEVTPEVTPEEYPEVSGGKPANENQ